MKVFHINTITLTSFIMLPFALLFVPLSCISSLDLLMRLTPTTNQGSLIWRWISYGLLSVVGHGCVRELLQECLLIIDRNYLAMDGVQPKMSSTISFSGMYRKLFIYRRNRTNSQ